MTRKSTPKATTRRAVGSEFAKGLFTDSVAGSVLRFTFPTLQILKVNEHMCCTPIHTALPPIHVALGKSTINAPPHSGELRNASVRRGELAMKYSGAMFGTKPFSNWLSAMSFMDFRKSCARSKL